MNFFPRKRRSPPSIIIVSLIDVLIVVLIFLMITTTVKTQPAVKLALPESKQAVAGSTDKSIIVTLPKEGPIYLGPQPVTIDRLQQRLAEAVKLNPQITLSIRADTDAPVGQMFKIMDLAKAAGIKSVSAFTKEGVKPSP